MAKNADISDVFMGKPLCSYMVSLVLTLALLCGLFGTAAAEDGRGLIPSHPPKVLSSDMFPCSGCHAGMPADTQKRELSFHNEITLQGHGEPRRWCLDCHDAGDRDSLRLINSEKVKFINLHLLCGQCHGKIYDHWRHGIHGKRTGNWDGDKQYFLCTSCHNPHSPRFRQLTPEPVPVKPAESLR